MQVGLALAESSAPGLLVQWRITLEESADALLPMGGFAGTGVTLIDLL